MDVEGHTPIAEYRVIWVFPSGERRPGRIAICSPEPDPDPDLEHDTTWACWLAIDGLQNRPLLIRGNGSLQPLMLALQFVGYDLRAFIASGGKVIDETDLGTSGVLSMFRVLMRRPSDPPPPDPVLADLDAEIAEAERGCEEGGTGEPE